MRFYFSLEKSQYSATYKILVNNKQKKLDKSLDKQGYKPTLETRAGTEVSAFDNANRIRGGLKKGGSVKKKKGGLNHDKDLA